MCLLSMGVPRIQLLGCSLSIDKICTKDGNLEPEHKLCDFGPASFGWHRKQDILRTPKHIMWSSMFHGEPRNLQAKAHSRSNS